MEMVDLREEPDEELLDAVASGLYLDSFPVAEEREDPAGWPDALWGASRDSAAPLLRAVVAGTDLHTPDRSIHGFVWFELYRASRCGLISYIGVDPDRRRNGLGRLLVEHAVETLHRDAADDPLAAVLAEIHDPERVPPSADSMDAAERVSFFAKLRARKVPIPYVQPELEPGAGAALGLDLIALPHNGQETRQLRAESLRKFLKEYYDASGAGETAELRRMLDALREPTVALEPLNRRDERPALAFERYGIAFHFVVPGERLEAVPPASEQFASFERDLLAYSYRGRPPFSSKAIHVPRACRVVHFETSPELRYVSEGKMATLVAPDPCEARVLQVRASATTFRSGVVVLHLVLTPPVEGTDCTLTEFDVIKLVKLWEGGEDVDGPYDEGEGADRCIRFTDRDGRMLTLRKLAAAVFQDERLLEQAPRAGTLQLAAHDEDCVGVWAAARDVPGFAAGEPEVWDRIRAPVEALAGIVQGLVDFEEIDEDELADVFAGVTVEESGVRGLHKGTLLTIGTEERALEVGMRSYGVSPYLLIPHAVMLHNEEQLERAAAVARKAESRHFRDLQEAKTTMHEALDRAFLPDVFHYSMERDLYESGHRSRGLAFREQQLRQRSEQVNSDYEIKINTRRGIADDVRNGLLLVVSYTSYRAAFPSAPQAAVLGGLIGLSMIYLIWRWAPPSSWRLRRRQAGDRAPQRSA